MKWRKRFQLCPVACQQVDIFVTGVDCYCINGMGFPHAFISDHIFCHLVECAVQSTSSLKHVFIWHTMDISRDYISRCIWEDLEES